MGLEIFALMLASSQLAMYGLVIGKSLMDNTNTKHFLWDMNNTKWCNGFYIEFRQSFTKEFFSYDEHLKS